MLLLYMASTACKLARKQWRSACPLDSIDIDAYRRTSGPRHLSRGATMASGKHGRTRHMSTKHKRRRGSKKHRYLRLVSRKKRNARRKISGRLR